MNQIILYVLSYLIVFLGTLATINFLSKGWLLQYLKVKISRGKKLLVEVFDVDGVYYTTAKIQEKLLEFKDRSKTKRRVPVKNVHITRTQGVKTVRYSTEKDKLMTPNLAFEEGKDTELIDHIFEQVANRPTLKGNKDRLIMLLLFGILGATLIIIALQTGLIDFATTSNTAADASQGVGVVQ